MLFQRGIRQIIGRRGFASPSVSAPKAGAKTGPSALTVALAVAVPVGVYGAFYYIDGQQKLAARKAFMVAKAKEDPTPGLTNPNEFKDFELLSIETLTPNTKRFVFALPEDATHLGLPTASCLVTKFTGPDGKDVIRPYTPVEDPKDGYTGKFDIIVKKYPTGVMSSHFFDLKKGDKLAMKGPIQKYKYEANKDGHIGMVAGGTGITPMLQVIQRALSNPNDETKLTLLFANVTEQDIILKSYLDDLASKHKDRLSVFYTLDKPPANWTGRTGYVTPQMLTELMPAPGQGKVFVCGPPPFVNGISGPKAKDFSQGELSGYLAKLGYAKDDVFKF
ncbi:NADH-cytochrome b5 reductase [Rhizoclosmatium hyalinum]|nr:NADH-cytochrome b5 reductase [Rhizoclosmatium hyalinum]